MNRRKADFRGVAANDGAVSNRIMKTLRLSFALLAVATAASAQTSPPRRAHHTLFYDPARERVLLTGGSTPTDGGRGFQFFNDLWSFDGTKWTALPSSGERLSGTRIEADDSRVVSFGGYNGSSIGEVRVLQSGAWVTIGKHPSLVAAEPGFVYDAARKRFMTFGGSSGPRMVNGEVWELAGTQWTKNSGDAPPARAAHLMVYDARRKKTVVFGGMGASQQGQAPVMLGDLWEFDGAKWTRIEEDSGPSPRLSPGAAYDSKRGRIILFGGAGSQGFLGDTWSWDGTRWRKLADTGPEPRVMGYLAYDAKRDRIVLFGGRKGYPDGDLDDTWEFDGASWKKISR